MTDAFVASTALAIAAHAALPAFTIAVLSALLFLFSRGAQ
jgi:hypothetical protein